MPQLPKQLSSSIWYSGLSYLPGNWSPSVFVANGQHTLTVPMPYICIFCSASIGRQGLGPSVAPGCSRTGGGGNVTPSVTLAHFAATLYTLQQPQGGCRARKHPMINLPMSPKCPPNRLPLLYATLTFQRLHSYTWLDAEARTVTCGGRCVGSTSSRLWSF